MLSGDEIHVCHRYPQPMCHCKDTHRRESHRKKGEWEGESGWGWPQKCYVNLTIKSRDQKIKNRSVHRSILHSHIYCHNFGKWLETREPRRSPCRPRQNMPSTPLTVTQAQDQTRIKPGTPCPTMLPFLNNVCTVMSVVMLMQISCSNINRHA